MDENIILPKTKYQQIIHDLEDHIQFYYDRAESIRNGESYNPYYGKHEEEICSAYANGMSNALLILKHKIASALKENKNDV